MRTTLLILSYLTLVWQFFRFAADADGFWHGGHHWLQNLAWIAGASASIIIQHGKAASRFLSQAFRLFSFWTRKAARFFEECYSNWDDLTSGANEKTARKASVTNDSAAINESEFASLKPTFPAPVVIALVFVAAAGLSALIVSAGMSPQPVSHRLAQSDFVKTKEGRLPVPATFADRFVVPGDCSACGGPIVEFLPMPKRNPLRTRNSNLHLQ